MAIHSAGMRCHLRPVQKIDEEMHRNRKTKIWRDPKHHALISNQTGTPMTTAHNTIDTVSSVSGKNTPPSVGRVFIGKLNVRIAETELRPVRLIVAKNDSDAMCVLSRSAAKLYGRGDEPCEDGGYYANGGEIHVSPFSMQEIALATFLDLKK